MKKTIEQRPLLSFFFLAYLLSWIVWVTAVFVGKDDEELGLLLMLLGVFGPMIAGIIVNSG